MSRAGFVCLSIIVGVLAVNARAQQFCHETNGGCFQMPPVAVACNGEISWMPCPATSPTPTPTATPTPAPPGPTPTPLTYSVQVFLRASDLGWTYAQGLTMMDGVVWLSGGVCCPAVGDGIGECVAMIDYTGAIPTFRTFWCSYKDTIELWETGLVQLARSERYRWTIAGVSTRRPAVPALNSAAKDEIFFGFGLDSVTQPFFAYVGNVSRNAFTMPGWRLWPQALLDIAGQRYFYFQYADPQMRIGIGRLIWSEIYGSPLWTSQTLLTTGAEPPLFSGIAVDTDGSLIATTGWWPSQDNVAVDVWRSKDEGRTWAKAGIRFVAPAGMTLFGCGWEHKSGGAALVPWHLLCTVGTGLGPDVGDWNLGDVRVSGAKLPPSWGKKPVQWKAQTP